jgi:glycosyltransferase involved in cell wall biosynthesis
VDASPTVNVGYLTPTIPYPPDEGAEIVAYNRISGLVDKGHNVYLFSVANKEPDNEVVSQLDELCRAFYWTARNRGVREYLSRLEVPYSVGTRHVPELQQKLNETERTASLDIVLADHTHMSVYLKQLSVPTCLGVHNVEYCSFLSSFRSLFPRPASLPHGIETYRMYRYERSLFESNFIDDFIFISKSEINKVGNIFNLSGRSYHVPVGINATGFNNKMSIITDGDPALVFTGTMRYPPNVDAVQWFVNNVFPEVREEFPDAEFLVVGKEPTSRVMELDGVPGVTITGAVPAIEPYLKAADVSVVPVRVGAGVQIKLLEALAAGNPTVSTPLAVEGTDVVDEEHVLIAETAPGFAAAISRVLSDDGLSERLSAEARRFFDENHSWETAVEKLECTLNDISDSHI